MGSSPTFPVQSRLSPLWLCVQAKGKYTVRSLLCYGCWCTGSSHIVDSLTATGLLQVWYNGLMKLGCLSQQLWGICQITLLSCCALCKVCLFIKQQKEYDISGKPVAILWALVWRQYLPKMTDTYTLMHMVPTIPAAASGGIKVSARHHCSWVLHVVAGKRMMDTALTCYN